MNWLVCSPHLIAMKKKDRPPTSVYFVQWEFAVKLYISARIISNKKDNNPRPVTILQPFMTLLSQLLFSTGSAKWCTILPHCNFKLSFRSRGPSGVLKQSGKTLFTGKCKNLPTYQVQPRHNVRGDLPGAGNMSPGLPLFPWGLIWTQIASVKAQPGSSLCCPSYCSNIKEPRVPCCTASSNCNAPIISQFYCRAICQTAEEGFKSVIFQVSNQSWEAPFIKFNNEKAVL